METPVRVPVLCVDDEPRVLEGLAVTLRRQYAVTTAGGGAAGLEALQKDPSIAVVLSDMRMPGMDGAAFLGQARRLRPDAVRMMLTGQTDLQSAISAVNDGHVFQFLTKPCPQPTLLAAFQAATTQHRLLVSERVLLEQTLRGSIRMLTDVMSLANPAVFGRATRIKNSARDLAVAAGLDAIWKIEVAGMLSQIGCISLPPSTLDGMLRGAALAPEEQAQVDRLPALAHSLLGNIPRLDDIRAALLHQTRRFDGSDPKTLGPSGDQIPAGARVLKIVVDFDVLEAQALSIASALDVMRGRTGWYDPVLLDAFVAMNGSSAKRVHVRELPLQRVAAGMVFAEDVKTSSGALLLPRGYEVTEELVDRIRNFAVKGDVRVIMGGPLPPPVVA